MAAIAVAGVGLLCCVSSSVAAVVYNKGDEEDPVVPKTGAGPSAEPIAEPIADYTFTNAEIVGQFGPTLPELTKVYTSKMKEVTSMSKQGFQVWTVPETGTYRIDAYGAKGGVNTYNNNPPGLGAHITGDFTLTKGTKLVIIVGQQAPGFKGNTHSHGTGGGGASWVLKDNFTTSTGDIYMVAGGGAGAPTHKNSSSGDANGTKQANVNDKAGGAASIDIRNAGGGAGWGGNGLGTRAMVASHQQAKYESEGPTGGKSPANGATGGNSTYYVSSNLSGGFGGGGAASIQIPGGGGGFSGGDAGGNISNSPPAQGGTSWIMTSAKNRQFLGNHDDNNGKVEITIKS